MYYFSCILKYFQKHKTQTSSWKSSPTFPLSPVESAHQYKTTTFQTTSQPPNQPKTRKEFFQPPTKATQGFSQPLPNRRIQPPTHGPSNFQPGPFNHTPTHQGFFSLRIFSLLVLLATVVVRHGYDGEDEVDEVEGTQEDDDDEE